MVKRIPYSCGQVTLPVFVLSAKELHFKATVRREFQQIVLVIKL